MKIALAIVVALGAVLLFLLASASANTALFAQNYPWLLAINGIAAVALLVLVGLQLRRLRQDFRAGVFGSRLKSRLLLMLSLMAVLPGALVYAVSMQFAVKSIDSWFDVRVDAALEGGLNLGRSMLESQQSELLAKARSAALDLGDGGVASAARLNRLRENASAQSAALITLSGQVLASSSAELGSSVAFVAGTQPVAPGAQRARHRAHRRCGRWRADGARAGSGRRQRVHRGSADPATDPDGAAIDHQERGERRDRASRLPGAATRSRRPQADLHPDADAGVVAGPVRRDRPGILAGRAPGAAAADPRRGHAGGGRRRLHAARHGRGLRRTGRADPFLQQHDPAAGRGACPGRAPSGGNRGAQAYLESVLANLSAGVLAFDLRFRLRAANRGALAILGDDLSGFEQMRLQDWPRHETLAGEILESFARRGGEWQQQLELARPDGMSQALLVRGKALPAGGGGGYVVVFDDITQLIAAQRSAAWGEVAQRLAHEIKNPLTPIQLSAERLQLKLADQLSGPSRELLDRATQTIVNQVEAMKNMVNDFRDYARTPLPQLAPVDLAALLGEVLDLYHQSRAAIAASPAPTPGLPRVLADANQLRQVLHNVLTNAQDALAETADPKIAISIAQDAERMRLTVRDNGPGFPPQILSRAFEPYVTTKAKGTGLGLAIVKKIVDDHGGEIRLGSDHGGEVSIWLPLAEGKAEAAALLGQQAKVASSGGCRR
jgi:nitrogen fixation/metabolism regulation signal transduction histidine kinase